VSTRRINRVSVGVRSVVKPFYDSVVDVRPWSSEKAVVIFDTSSGSGRAGGFLFRRQLSLARGLDDLEDDKVDFR